MPATEASTNASRERFDFIGGILPSGSAMRSPTERGPYLFRHIRRTGTSRQPRKRYPMAVSRNNKRAARRNRLAPSLAQHRAEPLRGYPHPAAHGRPPSPARERELRKLALSSQPYLGASSSHPLHPRRSRPSGPGAARGGALRERIFFRCFTLDAGHHSPCEKIYPRSAPGLTPSAGALRLPEAPPATNPPHGATDSRRASPSAAPQGASSSYFLSSRDARDFRPRGRAGWRPPGAYIFSPLRL
jgi:hypothetical protein